MAAIIWFALTGLLVIAELMLGSLYLLALGLGALAAGLVAYWEYGLSWQLLTAFGLSSLAAWIVWLNRRSNQAAPEAMDDPDIGQSVVLLSLSPLLVHYRGADWQAEWHLNQPSQAQAGTEYRIIAKHANQLVIGTHLSHSS
jgi:membrane protein implicated in regulation of membrane protease activity